MGKLTILILWMAIFNSYVKSPEGRFPGGLALVVAHDPSFFHLPTPKKLSRNEVTGPEHAIYLVYHIIQPSNFQHPNISSPWNALWPLEKCTCGDGAAGNSVSVAFGAWHTVNPYHTKGSVFFVPGIWCTLVNPTKKNQHGNLGRNDQTSTTSILVAG